MSCSPLGQGCLAKRPGQTYRLSVFECLQDPSIVKVPTCGVPVRSLLSLDRCSACAASGLLPAAQGTAADDAGSNCRCRRAQASSPACAVSRACAARRGRGLAAWLWVEERSERECFTVTAVSGRARSVPQLRGATLIATARSIDPGLPSVAETGFLRELLSAIVGQRYSCTAKAFQDELVVVQSRDIALAAPAGGYSRRPHRLARWRVSSRTVRSGSRDLRRPPCATNSMSRS